MTDFPGDIDTFRAQSNIPGHDFDSSKETTIYAEDFTNRSDAIIAIEETLGTNPQGSEATVSARIAAVESGGSGNVVGPATSSSNAVAIYGDTTGKLIKDTSVFINEYGEISFPDGSYINNAEANFAGALLVAGYLEVGDQANFSYGITFGATSTASDLIEPISSQDAATKNYVDTGLATKQVSLGYTAENAANKSTTTTLGTSDTLYPSQKAVKTYVDAAIASVLTGLFPIDAIWSSGGTNTNPATLLGFGTWTKISDTMSVGTGLVVDAYVWQRTA